jgi:hypothetical protein
MNDWGDKLSDIVSNPMVQFGTGLLARQDRGFWPAMSGTMNNMAVLSRLRREQAQAQEQQAWIAQNMPELQGMPPAVQQQYLQQKFSQQSKPEIRQAADGYNYYTSGAQAGQRVFPDVVAAPKTPLVTVDVGAQEKKEAQTVGGYFGTRYGELLDAAESARRQMAEYARLNKLLESVYTGTGSNTFLQIKKAGEMLGLDFEGVGEAEAAEALSSQMALKLRNPAGGAGMPGAMSDKDREFLAKMVPRLATSAEGRRLMFETRRRLNQRSIDVARKAREYRKKHGQLDEGFFDVLDAWSAKRTLFEDLSDPAPVGRGRVTWGGGNGTR